MSQSLPVAVAHAFFLAFAAASTASLVLGACTSPSDPPAEDTDAVEDTATHTAIPPTDTGAPGFQVEILPSSTCASPGARAEAPFDRLLDGDWGEQSVDVGPAHFILGSGLAVGDLDGDDFPDVVIPRDQGVELYLNDGHGGMSAAPFPDVGRGGVGASVADFDGDGDLDVYLSQYLHEDRLLANDGTGSFTDVTDEVGLSIHPYGVGSSWGDLDGDGDLDLLVLEHGNWVITKSVESHVYENRTAQGSPGFIERIDAFPADEGYGHTLAGGILDLDDDHQPDVYLVNDYGWIRGNRLFWNDVGALSVAAPGTGTHLRVCGMGLATSDLNGDRIPDLFLSSWLEHRMLLSFGNRSWVDATLLTGLDVPQEGVRHVAWGADFGDIDNDADDDLFVAYGFIQANLPNPFDQPDALYIAEGTGFSQQAAAFGIADLSASRGAMLVDLDHDGWLDLAKRNRLEPAVIELARCGEASWLTVELRQDGPNTRAIGAEVHVTGTNLTQSRWIRAGGRSVASGGPPEAHFGLGNRGSVDIEITWPDGTVSTHPDIGTSQRIRIHRP